MPANESSILYMLILLVCVNKLHVWMKSTLWFYNPRSFFCGKFIKFGFSISGKYGARPFTVCTIFDKYGNFFQRKQPRR
jgi:hypothetical protein